MGVVDMRKNVKDCMGMDNLEVDEVYTDQNWEVGTDDFQGDGVGMGRNCCTDMKKMNHNYPLINTQDVVLFKNNQEIVHK